MLITGEPKQVAAAYIAARSEIQTLIPKDGQANRSRYVTLGAILEAITPILAVHDLVILQEPLATDTAVGVATSILHESGASIDFGTLLMPFGDGKPQSVGSALSYARRYALTAVLGLAGDDDDGQAAQDSFKARPTAKPAPATNGSSYHDDALWDTPATHDEMRDEASTQQVQSFHILGKEVYGAEAWKVEGPKMVPTISNGRCTSSTKLHKDEIDVLIKDLQALRNKGMAAVAGSN